MILTVLIVVAIVMVIVFGSACRPAPPRDDW
jgi:hypothetical protein